MSSSLVCLLKGECEQTARKDGHNTHEDCWGTPSVTVSPKGCDKASHTETKQRQSSPVLVKLQVDAQ